MFVLRPTDFVDTLASRQALHFEFFFDAILLQICSSAPQDCARAPNQTYFPPTLTPTAAPVFKTIESSSFNSNIVWNLYLVRSAIFAISSSARLLNFV